MGLNPTKVYLDSCIVIYLLEEHPQFSGTVRHAFETAEDRQFYISPLVELECLVVPLRNGNPSIIQRYESFFQQQISLDIEPSIYRFAAELRSRHRLKTPDALHLAIAHHYECVELWTNDHRLHEAATNNVINVLSSVQT
jgi:uncharacterized protein